MYKRQIWNLFSLLIGAYIANVILRHKEAACELPSGWPTDKLSELTVHALNTIYTFVFERNAYIMMAYTWKKPFPAPAFAMMFPLLRIISKGRGSVIKGDEEMRMKVLQIVMAHSKMRSPLNSESTDEVCILDFGILLSVALKHIKRV